MATLSDVTFLMLIKKKKTPSQWTVQPTDISGPQAQAVVGFK